MKCIREEPDAGEAEAAKPAAGGEIHRAAGGHEFHGEGYRTDADIQGRTAGIRADTAGRAELYPEGEALQEEPRAGSAEVHLCD